MPSLSPDTATAAARPARRHDIDALRVIAFSLLILYHVGMFYVAEWDWHVKSAYQADWLQLPMQLLNQWRMPLIFLISGLALSLVWRRYTPLRLAGRRAHRLGIPLVFGMAVVAAPQAFLEGRAGGVLEPGYWRFWFDYLTFGDFPAEAWGGADEYTWTWMHLWYLPYLLLYTLLLIPLAVCLDRPANPLRGVVRRLRGFRLVALPVVPLFVWGNLVWPHFPYISHALFDDAYAHAMYGTFFCYGFLIGRDEGLWAELARLRRVTFILALASFAGYLALAEWVGEDAAGWRFQLLLAATFLNRWLWILAVLGWGHALLNRPFRWLPYATEAVFPWYVLHQTLIVVAGYHVARLSLGPVLEPILILAATIGGCHLLHEYAIRRIDLLRPLFGLGPRKRAQSSPPAPSTADAREAPSAAGVR